MKSARFALFAAPLVLLACCGERKPADPLAGLSEVEQRAAKAQATNICKLAAKDGVANVHDAEMLVRIGDLAVGAQKGGLVKIVGAGNAIARVKGCVPKLAPPGWPYPPVGTLRDALRSFSRVPRHWLPDAAPGLVALACRAVLVLTQKMPGFHDAPVRRSNSLALRFRFICADAEDNWRAQGAGLPLREACE